MQFMIVDSGTCKRMTLDIHDKNEQLFAYLIISLDFKEQLFCEAYK
jgi:hypothetical protein